MTIWIIEPRDPLIVRDGRPFGPDPGARATTLLFPFPSTVAGGLRGVAGRAEGQQFRIELSEIVREHVHVCGPLLVEVNDDGIVEWYAPAPADATIHELTSSNEDQGALLRLVPLALSAGVCTNLPNNLLPVGQPGTPDKRKPHPRAPQFWRWDAFEQWLTTPKKALLTWRRMVFVDWKLTRACTSASCLRRRRRARVFCTRRVAWSSPQSRMSQPNSASGWRWLHKWR